MQGAYIAAMEDSRPYRLNRRARLEELLAEAGGPKVLHGRSGVTDTYLTACRNGKRDMGDAAATKLERAMKRPIGWMDTSPSGEQQLPPTLDQLLALLSVWVKAVPPERIPALAENVAGWIKAGATEPWTGIVRKLLEPVEQVVSEADSEAAVQALNSLRAAPPVAPGLGQPPGLK